MQQEQANRRSRRASMDEAAIKGKQTDEWETEFNKTMVFAFGESELLQRQRDQMFGNMHFLVELFKLKLVKGTVIKTCLEDLF